MNSFTIHDKSSAPAASRPTLQAVQQSLGFVPNLFGLFANSPAVLEAYTTLSALQDSKTGFDESERQVLYLSISAQNGCEYCVAAHSTIAGMKRVPADVVRAVREGTRLANPKHEALRAFAVAMVEGRGIVGDEALATFRAAGYEDRHALEVVLAIAFKTISNYANHMAGTPLDAAFQPQAWSAGATV